MTQESSATATALNIHYVDIPVAPEQTAPLRFVFNWIEDDRWEPRDYQVNIHETL